MSQINITLGEFIETYRNVIGFGADNKCAYDLINRARIIAYPMGDWVGTITVRPIQIFDSGFILPYDLDTVKSAKRCGEEININSEMSLNDYRCLCDEVIVRGEGRIALPFQLTGKYPLEFYAVNKKDEGVEMEASYIDEAGSFRDETVSLLHQQRTRLITIPSSISRIRKKKTVGRIAIIHGDKSGFFYPEDKNPSYTVYSSSICNACIAIEAKKKYIPYTVDDENSILDLNPEAISSLIIAIKAKDKRDQNWANEYAVAVKMAKDFFLAELKNEKSTSSGFHSVEFANNFHDSLTNP